MIIIRTTLIRLENCQIFDKEVAATQVALWHYSDGVDANTVTNNTIRDRALEIIADADANAGSNTAATTLEILPSIDPDAFYVKDSGSE
ncbi:MAG: thioester domain-containing protein [Ignavibacteria bacterium]